jgi:hypothetical protein
VDACPSITEAARRLNVPRSTLDSRLREARCRGIEPKPKPEPEIVEISKPRVRIKAGSSDGTLYRVLAIGDLHDDPAIEKDRCYWLGCHAKETSAEYVISIGDWATLDSLNSHIPNDTLRARQKNPYTEDMASLCESLERFHEGLGGHQLRKHITLGNHERRAWAYEESHPEMAGQLTGDLLLTFEERGWTWTEYGEFYFLGGVGFVHAALNRLGKTYGGKNAEQQIANDAVFDIVVGHSHTGRSWRAPKIGPSKFVNVLNLGCALPHGHVEDYAQHCTTGWTWGAYDLIISGGHIESAAFISMQELERRYGQKR